MTESENAPRPEERVFLVVVDDTEEMAVALRYACQRAANSGGRVAMLRVCAPVEFQHWQTVGDLMRQEQRESAWNLLERLHDQVVRNSGKEPLKYVREGEVVEQVLGLVNEEPSISILILGAAAGAEGPGPLVSNLTHRRVGHLRVPVTVVPGTLTDEQIHAIA